MLNFKDIFFKFASVVGHPILLPTYFALSLNEFYQVETWRVFLYSVLLPVLAISFVFYVKEYVRKKKSKPISEEDFKHETFQSEEIDIQMNSSSGFVNRIENFFFDTQNRTICLLIIVLSSVAGILFLFVRGSMWLLIMLLTMISAVACMLINNFWRLSLHAFGWGFACYSIVYQYIYLYENKILPATVVIIASGIVMASRLYLGKHNKLQVYLGFILGLIISTFMFSTIL